MPVETPPSPPAMPPERDEHHSNAEPDPHAARPLGAHDGGSLRVAVVGGIPIRIHLTFLLLLAWVGFAGAETGKGNAFASIVFVVLLFACVVLHELSHAMVAKRFGIHTLSITLYPIGGVALLEKPAPPRQEFWIAIAGPLMNLLIAGLIAAGLTLSHVRGGLQPSQSASGMVADLLWANLILGAFNMIPAFPMDGGRVLRSIIAHFTDEVRATEIAATIGQLLALAFGVYALMQGQFLLLLVAAFVYFGAGQEANAFRTRALVVGHKVREAMMTEVRTIDTGHTLREAAKILLSGSQHDFPVMNGDEVAGLLSREALMRGIATEEDNSYVTAIMDREFPRTIPDADLETVLTSLGRAGSVLVLGKEASGREYLVGMLTQENAIEFLMLKQLTARRAAHAH
jgi:Zn-dependent protease/CBS domain-containing protein